MAGLQRSAVSFRRQGSSGLIWDDKFLQSADQTNQKEDNNINHEQQQEQLNEAKPPRAVRSINSLDRSRSNGGGRGFRTVKVSPAIEPSSPKLSACGFCSAFGKEEKTRRRPKSGKRRT